MRYHGQGHEIEVALPDRALDKEDISVLESRFEAEYARQFSRTVPGMKIEILNWAVKVSSKAQSNSINTTSPSLCAAKPEKLRTIRCDVTNLDVQAAVIHRNQLHPGDKIAGPALIIEPQTTTLVSSDFEAITDANGNLLLTRKP